MDSHRNRGSGSSDMDDEPDWTSYTADNSNSLGGGFSSYNYFSASYNHPSTSSYNFNSPQDYSLFPLSPPAPFLSPPPAHHASLFDPSESALFSSFLNTIQSDDLANANEDSFLFNPVLPFGMPSPPPGLLGNDEERGRDGLGREVGSINLHGKEEEGEDDAEEEEEEEEEEEGNVTIKLEEDPSQSPSPALSVSPPPRPIPSIPIPIPATRGSSRSKKPKISPQPSPSPARSLPTRRPRRSSTLNKPIPPSRSPSPSQTPSPTPSSPPQEEDTGSTVKPSLTDSQKRTNHILSEQKRRNAIRSGFKDLVDLLSAGELLSGIVVAPPLNEVDEPEENQGKKKKTTTSGRGRGRKGEIGAGASKSVVLEKAVEYICWLDRGNQAVQKEIERVEKTLREKRGR